jgi:hypothetical protein
MYGPYGTRWADVDEPEEVVTAEDAKFMSALGVWNVQNSMRPPEPDEMPGQPWEPHPESLRGKVIALYLATEEVERLLRATWRGRMVLRLARIWSFTRRHSMP